MSMPRVDIHADCGKYPHQALARIRQIAGQPPVPQGEPGAGLYRRKQGSAADVDTDLDRSASGGGRGSESDHRG
jgi:hypothetical protein